MKTTIFLADDHAVVLDGLRLLLETQSDFSVIGTASNGRAAVREISRLCPDVAILDISMPEMNGIDATQYVRENCPNTRVIILSMHANTGHIARALQAGAQGYVLKSSVGTEVIDAIRKVLAGSRYLSQKVSNQIVEDYLGRLGADESISPLKQLTTREREILQLVVEGKSSAQIADTLSISPNTVDTYRSRIMTKLNLHDLPSLVKFAIQHGLITLE